MSEAKPHTWDKSGERCIKCGEKDWMAGPECKPKPIYAGEPTMTESNQQVTAEEIVRELADELDELLDEQEALEQELTDLKPAGHE